MSMRRILRCFGLGVIGWSLVACPAAEPDHAVGACRLGVPESESEGVCEWIAQGRCYATADDACRCICPASRVCRLVGEKELRCDWDAGTESGAGPT